MTETGKSRPDWDDYLLGFARHASLRSSCDRKRIGCVFTLEHRVLVTAYNGAVSGLRNCIERGHIIMESVENGVAKSHCQLANHAEANAIAWAARKGIALEGSTVYLTHYPCYNCAKLMIQAGVVEIVYELPFADTLAEQFLAEAGVRVRQIEGIIAEWVTATEYADPTAVASGLGITTEDLTRNMRQAVAASDFATVAHPMRTPLERMLAWLAQQGSPAVVSNYELTFELATKYGLTDNEAERLLDKALGELEIEAHFAEHPATAAAVITRFDSLYQRWSGGGGR